MTCTTIMKTLKKETFLSFEYSFIMQLSHLGVSHNFPQDEDALAEGLCLQVFWAPDLPQFNNN